MKKIHTIVVCLLLMIAFQSFAQEKKFDIKKQIAATSIKNQSQSGTCWSFATLSFIESELIREGKGEHDLSEMYIARKSYVNKVQQYIRMMGNMFFTAGGQTHDVLNIIRKYGIVPESVYSGKLDPTKNHNHAMLDSAMLLFANKIFDKKGKVVIPAWQDSVEVILDTYLGVVPKTFEQNGKKYDAMSFAKSIGLDASDYLEVTSYTHHPFYSQFVLESRYNWSGDLYYNIPLNEFMESIDNAIDKGYTVVFNGDVSEKTFQFSNSIGYLEDNPTVTQESRQANFDSHTTTVDHVMHIVGIAYDEEGIKYYLTKNSWGTGNTCKGYLYLSEGYIKDKAVSITIHKAAISKSTLKKMQLPN